MRASSTIQEVVKNYMYYAELGRRKNGLEDNPHYIDNLDETGGRQQHKRQNIIALKRA